MKITNANQLAAYAVKVFQHAGWMAWRQNNVAVRIEDAGFEIRDMIAWVYGSGFPKSLDVSKAIDKAAGARGHDSVGFNVAGKTSGLGVIQRPELRSDHPDYVKPQGITDAAKQWDGWGTALKPALEPITVARKPLVGTVADNVQQHGTGALNVDGCRILALTGQRPNGTLTAWESENNLCNSCARLAASPAKPETPAIRGIFAGSPAAPTTSEKGENDRADTDKADTGCSAGLCQEGRAISQPAGSSLSIGVSGKTLTDQSRKVTKSTTSTAMDSTTGLKTCNACGCSITDRGTSESMLALKSGTPNMPAEQGSAALGRWPSNLIHDGSEEVTALFPQAGGGFGKRGGRASATVGDYGMGATMETVGYGDTGSAARFFYVAKASKADRDEGCEGLEIRLRKTHGDTGPSDNAKPNGQQPVPSRNHHPTVKPTALMRYLCRLVTPPGGVVLDPFMGSGSTGKATAVEGFRFIGIEQDETYFNIAHARIQDAYSQRLI